MMPALLSANVNDSQKDSTNDRIAFMQIDCEVVDTRLFYIKTDDIPQMYMSWSQLGSIWSQSVVELRRWCKALRACFFEDNNVGF